MKDQEKCKVSVILPSYNERENIVEAIERLSAALGKDLHEIIIIDDNSPDGTWKIVQDLKKPHCKLIRRMDERGLASAIARGIDEAQGNIIAWLDCDLGVPPEVLPPLVEKLYEYDVAIASRYVDGGKDTRPRFRAFLSVLINYFANLLLGFEVRDYTSGVIAVRKDVFGKITLSKKGFGEYFTEFVYKCVKNNYRIIEVGYIYETRKRGISKSDGSILTLFKYGFQYGFKIIGLRLGR